MSSSIVRISLAVLSATVLASALPQDNTPKDQFDPTLADSKFGCNMDHGINPDESKSDTALIHYTAKANANQDWKDKTKSQDSFLFFCVPKPEDGQGYDMKIARTFCDQDHEKAYPLGPESTLLSGEIKVKNGDGCNEPSKNLKGLSVSYQDDFRSRMADIKDVQVLKLLMGTQSIECTDLACTSPAGDCKDYKEGEGATCPLKISLHAPVAGKWGEGLW